ncbi:MAG: AMP-binding protein [Thermoleophilia bacterium]
MSQPDPSPRSDPRIPPREQVVLRYLLDRYAAERPDQVFVRFLGGEEWTFADLQAIARRHAAGFRALGVEQGDHVLSFLPNCREAIGVWYGLNYLGAVYIPANPAYRGNLLAHVVANSDAKLVVAHHQLVERLADVDRAALEDVVHVGGEGPDLPGLRRHPAAVFTDTPVTDEALALARPIEPWHTQGVWYTSGTTGPSKGVLSSYMHAYSMFGEETWPFLTSEDRYMINLPLFHMGGTGLFNSMLLRGGSLSFVERFRTDAFWEQVRETESTAVFLLGAMAAFLESQPPREDDRDHPMRLMFMVPVVDDVPAFAERFGVEVRSIYNMTEINTPIITGPTPSLPGTCGRLRPGVEVRLVDENDCEVPVGEVGEFAVRSDTPWSMNHGYYKMPEATAAAWRNGWFHTGDAGRMDEDGNYYFVDRIKDAIRRRGEFISSMELELELCAHPDVATAAVVAVRSEYAEDEILAVLKPVEGRTIDFVDLVEFLRPRVAHFMVPRYFRQLEVLPMTPTEKIRKVELRDQGITEDTWDREAAGIVIRAERL